MTQVAALAQVTVDLGVPVVSVRFVAGMVVLAALVGAGVAVLYRSVMGSLVPVHVALIFGVGAVALWTNTASTIVEFVERTTAQEPLLLENMTTNSVAIVASGVAAVLGARLGDRLAPLVRPTVTTGAGTRLDAIVGTIGRYITVELPRTADIADVEGYEAVPEDVKETVGGATFRFPRGLTHDQLHERLVDRLRDDYGVGSVDLELAEDGRVEHLSLGSREAGIGPTLPARRGAITLEATPPPGATPGDRVQVWRRDEEGARRVATGELRAATDTHVTLVATVDRLRDLDQGSPHRLVTLGLDSRPELEFVSLLRAANESMASLTLAADSPLVGVPVGALRTPVLAVRSAGTLVTAPGRSHALGAGDTVYAIGRPDELRKFRLATDATASREA